MSRALSHMHSLPLHPWCRSIREHPSAPRNAAVVREAAAGAVADMLDGESAEERAAKVAAAKEARMRKVIRCARGHGLGRRRWLTVCSARCDAGTPPPPFGPWCEKGLFLAVGTKVAHVPPWHPPAIAAPATPPPPTHAPAAARWLRWLRRAGCPASARRSWSWWSARSTGWRGIWRSGAPACSSRAARCRWGGEWVGWGGVYV